MKFKKEEIVKNCSIIVPGGLNTDIIALGVERILGSGELTLGGQLKIGPGGKARNMAQMMAAYLGKKRVAMIGRSSKDPYGLWKLPIDSLIKAGVSTEYVKILNFKDAGGKYPGIALIPVDNVGKNQIYVLPGVNADFSPQDIDDADELFCAGDNRIMVIALEISIDTVKYAIEKAFKSNIKVVLDPGGITGAIDKLINEKIFLLKPNEYETKILTGIEITGFKSAEQAANVLLNKGVKNIFITHGDRGGYLFNTLIKLHIPIPKFQNSSIQDETGCGDQVTAIIAACIAEGKNLIDSAKLAILAGTLQFYRAGIQPVTKADIFADAYIQWLNE